jgi:hypothetical protein
MIMAVVPQKPMTLISKVLRRFMPKMPATCVVSNERGYDECN